MIRIGTRDSQLAVWQATLVQTLLREINLPAELVYIKSEGDIDTVTPLYELGVQGIFTRSLDAALLSGRIDIAVHSLKDIPTRPADGIGIVAVLKRHSVRDILVYNGEEAVIKKLLGYEDGRWLPGNMPAGQPFTVATGSVRRMAQWKHRYPGHSFENLRGNVNTRLKKLAESGWNGAIFAAAGLERIGVRPAHSLELDWMLPAPAQGAIGITCRKIDTAAAAHCAPLNDEATAQCTSAERAFLRTLMGGCSTPIGALATCRQGQLHFTGNICSPDGSWSVSVEKSGPPGDCSGIGIAAAHELLKNAQVRAITGIATNGKEN